MAITTEDVQQLQAEAGQVENDLRLRAIVAERRVKELEKQVSDLETQLSKLQGKDKKEKDAEPAS